MKKQPVKLKFNKGSSLVKGIEYKKPSKNWRPTKRFWSTSLINLETGKVKDTYVVARNKEQEEKWKEIVNNQVEEFWKTVWGEKYDWFMQNAKYLIDKHGEEEFAKQWRKAMKEK